MNLTEQHRTFKYSLHTDGLGCSNRLQKVLATGQVKNYEHGGLLTDAYQEYQAACCGCMHAFMGAVPVLSGQLAAVSTVKQAAAAFGG